jgi:steroid delta-isomerase-like uncharacterized protein
MLEQHKAIVRRVYEEIWSQGKLHLADELLAPDYVNRDPATPGGAVHGPEGFKQLVSTYRTAFPDLTFTVQEQVAEGDVVVTRWIATGTHLGPLMGIPATGRRADAITCMAFQRFRDGKIVEVIANWDTLGLLRQLGIIPELAPAAV